MLRIDSPSFDELEEAESRPEVAVYSCFETPDVARIAFTKQRAVAGLANTTAKRHATQTTLLGNVAEAEFWLKSNRPPAAPKKSIKERLQAERARLSAARFPSVTLDCFY